MAGAAFFALGGTGANEKKLGGWAGQGVKSSGPGRVTVKLGAFSGWGSLENFRGRGSHFSWGLGRAGRVSLVFCTKTIVNKLLRDIIVIRIAFPIDWQCFRVCDIEQSWSKNNCLFAPSRAHKKANIWEIFLEKLINFHSFLILCNLNLRKLP